MESCTFNLDDSIEDLSRYYIEHGDSPFDDQLRRVAGDQMIDIGNGVVRVPHVISVEAKKNPKKDAAIRELIRTGFSYAGHRYKRYGKSASQAKSGITMFVRDDVFDYLMESSTLGVPPGKCVISKYEAQRCLSMSVCTLIKAPLPRIVIVDEYTKIMPQQYIRYVEQEDRSFIDKESGEKKKFRARVVKEGRHDVKLSPFDGCGCHTHAMSELWSSFIGLDYTAIGFQIRLPFFKGYSVEVPFREYYKEHGIKTIKDVFGREYKIDEIDCIWNISMWKAYGTFQSLFGDDGWNEYIRRLEKYEYKLGISKYSHHKKDIDLKARFNFQYLQCLNLKNDKYYSFFNKKESETQKYDILDENNWGKIVQLASYTTSLFERVIDGDKFYTLKFLGVEDTNKDANSRYIEAAMINDQMLKDPCLRRYLYRKLRSRIDQAKLGKIYADGFYHTVVGDMIGYLEYAAGLEPSGCLGPWEFFCKTMPPGKILSLRSPLVCPSEVNDVKIVTNSELEKWFGHFKDQDVVMIGMYDVSMPRQGGMECPSSLLETAG